MTEPAFGAGGSIGMNRIVGLIESPSTAMLSAHTRAIGPSPSIIGVASAGAQNTPGLRRTSAKVSAVA